MKILVIAATEFEIEPFIKENNSADILIMGIGIPQTIFNLSKKLFEKKYKLVVQAGIAGTFNDKIAKSGVVMVSKDTFGDIGINENGKFSTLFEKNFIEENDFPYHKGWLVNTHPYFLKPDLPVVKAITVNTVTDNTFQIKKQIEKFNPDIESMEGAAFHYVCLRQKINFLQLRSISNEVGERDKNKWDIKNAIVNLNIELKKLVQNFI